MLFEAGISGHKVLMDTDSSFGVKIKVRDPNLYAGGTGRLYGNGRDSILKKMRVQPNISGTVKDPTDEHPRHYNKIRVVYEFTGKDLPEDKPRRA